MKALSHITTRTSSSNWHFWLIVCLLSSFLAVRQIDALRQESETIDEGAHLVAGYSYWKTHDFRLTPTHPPLAHLLSALPLLLLQPDFSPDAEAWRQAEDYAIARQFLYENRVDADTLLMAGRLMTVLVTLSFGAVLAGWTRKRFGTAAGLFALFLFTFSPVVIAHGHYITTDMMVTAFLVCTCLSWLDYLDTGTTRQLFQTGVLAGLTFASKFNGLILIPVLVLLYVVYRRIHPQRSGWRHSAKLSICALVVVPWLIVYSTYFFETKSLLQDPRVAPTLMERQGVTRALAQIPVPAYYYFRGLQLLLRDFVGGHDGYVLGKTMNRGSWLYFPVAFAVKTPVATHILFVLCVILLASKIGTRSSIPFVYVGLGIPPLIYFFVCMMSTLNIGLRHLLPIYPFIFIMISAVVFGGAEKRYRKLAQIQALILACVLAVESMSIHPNYLAYFNGFAGGPANGPHYLIDSNLDWGQDLKKLKQWSDRRGLESICLSYFGQADPSYYGISYQRLDSLRDMNEVANADCVVAVSAHLLFEGKGDRFRALHQFVPDDRIGYSIYTYDFRKDRPSQ